MVDYIIGPSGRRIAYRATEGVGPAIIFLGGFRSDMTGTKAVWLEDWSRAQNRAFIRFDYSGHGVSAGRFEEGCISDWTEDAMAILDLVNGPAILVGSSMGGWISLLVAGRATVSIAALITIAAAPDFTEDAMWAHFDIATRARLMEEGLVHLPSDYGAPYPITRRLIEDGRENLVLQEPLHLPFPVRLLQGTDDRDVSPDVALRLLKHTDGADIRLTLVKGADHRFSTPDCLTLIGDTLVEVLERYSRHN